MIGMDGRTEQPCRERHIGAETPTSLSHTIEYCDAIIRRIASLDGSELIDVAARLSRAYREFPELEILRPRCDMLAPLRLAAAGLSEGTVGPLLVQLAALEAGHGLSVLVRKIGEGGDPSLIAQYLAWQSSLRAGEGNWLEFVDILQKHGRRDLVLRLFPEIWEHASPEKENDAGELGAILAPLLKEGVEGDTDNAALAKIAQSAQRRLSDRLPEQNRSAATDAMLTLAERLRPLVCPQMSARFSERGWQSGELAFDEFVLQWPCEVELPDAPLNQAFVDAAYRAILLRAPKPTERGQWIRLLDSGEVSRLWLVEDLLASHELRMLQRRVQVVWQGCTVTGPGRAEGLAMPLVSWPVT